MKTIYAPFVSRIYVREEISLGDSLIIKPGSTIYPVRVIAKGNKIKEVERLIEQYLLQDGNCSMKKDWFKKSGAAIIIDKTNELEIRGQVHWYECKNIGKVEFKVKR